jgi:hypothetical protein
VVCIGIGIVLPIEQAMKHPENFTISLILAFATVSIIILCIHRYFTLWLQVGSVFIIFAELAIFAFGYIDKGK